MRQKIAAYKFYEKFISGNPAIMTMRQSAVYYPQLIYYHVLDVHFIYRTSLLGPTHIAPLITQPLPPN